MKSCPSNFLIIRTAISGKQIKLIITCTLDTQIIIIIVNFIEITFASKYNYVEAILKCNCIIESVDSISRDGLDTPIILYTIQNEKPKYSVQIHF